MSENSEVYPFLSEAAERVRGFILDSQMPNPHDLSHILGCTPLSDEVAQHEEKESDKRIRKVSHLMPLIHAQAKALAEATVGYQQINTESKENVPEALWNESKRMLSSVATSAILGSISQLADMDFITVNDPRKKGKKNEQR